MEPRPLPPLRPPLLRLECSQGQGGDDDEDIHPRDADNGNTPISLKIGWGGEKLETAANAMGSIHLFSHLKQQSTNDWGKQASTMMTASGNEDGGREERRK